MTATVGVRVLGGVEVRQGDGIWQPVAGSGLRALVALLALRASRLVTTDQLIDELWGDDLPADPHNALQARVSQLRRLVGRDAVRRWDAGYELRVGPDDVDAGRLERIVREARDLATVDAVAASERFESALDLVTGPPLVDLLDHPFARAEATRIEELVLTAQEGLVDARLATGRHVDVVAELRSLVREHPLRERFQAQLVLALYRSGRQAEALDACRAARTMLREELGLEPGDELRTLEHLVLTQDGALAGRPIVPVSCSGAPRPGCSRAVSRRSPLARGRRGS